MKINQPLVSIIVITYNSSNYILETLESAKIQTYRNIELIISDDGSQDSTVNICREWLENNKYYFTNTELIAPTNNTGTVANINRGTNAAKGDWIKFVAGDDILLKDCIETFVKYVENNISCEIVFGKYFYLIGEELKEGAVDKFFFSSKEEQYFKIFRGASIPAPASFIKRNLLTKVGGFNNKYKLIEDVPLWIAIAKKGIRFCFMESFVVKYRIHEANICRNGITFINESFYNDEKNIIKNEIIPELLKQKGFWSVLNYINYIIIMDLIILCGNKNSYKSKLLDLLVISHLYKFIQKSLKEMILPLNKKLQKKTVYKF